jgi:hypothetical protein
MTPNFGPSANQSGMGIQPCPADWQELAKRPEPESKGRAPKKRVQRMRQVLFEPVVDVEVRLFLLHRKSAGPAQMVDGHEDAYLDTETAAVGRPRADTPERVSQLLVGSGQLREFRAHRGLPRASR